MSLQKIHQGEVIPVSRMLQLAVLPLHQISKLAKKNLLFKQGMQTAPVKRILLVKEHTCLQINILGRNRTKLTIMHQIRTYDRQKV